MKSSLKLFLFLSSLSFNAQAFIPLLAGRAALTVAQVAVRQGIPLVRQALPVAKQAALRTQNGFVKARHVVNTNPYLKDGAQQLRVQAKNGAVYAKNFIKEDPRRAAFMGTGAAVGYYTSDKGFVNTTVGTGLGATTGLYLSGLKAAKAAHTAQLALQAEVVEARALAGVAQSEASVAAGQVDTLKRRVSTLEEMLAGAAREAKKTVLHPLETGKQTFVERVQAWKALRDLANANKRTAGPGLEPSFGF